MNVNLFSIVVYEAKEAPTLDGRQLSKPPIKLQKT